jgi:NTP pyrophosphatase (non-canonical NTP hydrolase)
MPRKAQPKVEQINAAPTEVETKLQAELDAQNAERQRVQQYTSARDAHVLALNVQSAGFRAALATMTEFCGSWFTTMQGFNRDNFDGDCMLVVTEIAEAVEGDRRKAKDEHCPEFDSREVEIADTLVRLLHLASKYQLRLGDAFIAKQAYNLTRPVKHGKGY